MTRATEARQRDLERRRTVFQGRVHRFIAWSHEEVAGKEAALKASPAWTEDDCIIARIIVSPNHERTA